MNSLLSRITVEAGKCGGRPCIRGYRLRVKDVLELLAHGASWDEILTDYPFLEADDIRACLEFASAPAADADLLASVRQLPATARSAAAAQALKTVDSTPTAGGVFLRKVLLRMRDAARLETGAVTAADLQRENSPFAAADLRRARLRFRPRAHA